MSVSEDEDVIFQGSPLYESIVNSGSLAEELNIEFCDRDGSEQRQTRQTKEVFQGKVKLESPNVSVRQKIRQVYKKLLTWLGIAGKDDMNLAKDVEVVSMLLQSSVLDEDDSDFLQSYLEIPKVGNGSRHSKAFAFVSFAVVIPVLCSYGFLELLKMEHYWTFTIFSAALACTGVVTLSLAGLLLVDINVFRKYKYKLDAEKDIVRQYVNTDEGLVIVLRKSLRLIQETELIARGFTLVSQRNPISRLEASGAQTLATRQCPGLRKLVFTLTRDSIHYLRDITKQLITLRTAGSEIDMTSSYLAFEPVQSYGPCLQQDKNEIDLYNITDGVSIAALKGIFHLFLLHQSEFTRALTLTYSVNFKGPGKNNSAVLELLQTVSEKLQTWTAMVNESLTFHSCSLLSGKTSRRTAKSLSDIEDVYTAIHSLDLHLQSALTRVRTFSSWLETKSDSPEAESTGFHDDLVSNVMDPIKAELESCKSCWEEGVNRIERMLKTPRQDEFIKTTIGEVSPADNQERNTSQALEIEDYIIEDQVFEAYTDPNEMYHEDSDWEKPLTKEEKEKRKRDKHEALRMLTELKSVISIRAVDWEKRERAAFLRAHPEAILCQTANEEAEKKYLNNKVGKERFRQDKSDKSVSAVEKTCNSKVNQEDVKLTNHENIDDSLDGQVANIEEIVTERQPLSYVSYQGVRRLRKSNMLDLSDSDSDSGDPNTGREILTSHEVNEKESDEKENDERKDLPIKFGLPPILFSNVKNKNLDDVKEDFVSDDDDETVDVVDDYTEKPILTLEERLQQFSGANLSEASDIAAQAVAKSRLMGGLTEATFGGEVFGEYTSSENEDS